MKRLFKVGLALGGLMTIGYGNVATGSELSDLLDRQSQANSTCRDRADEVGEQACLEREEISGELSRLGYCYGDGVRPSSSAKWQPCSELQVIRSRIINSMTEYKFDGITAELTLFLNLLDEEGQIIEKESGPSYSVLAVSCRKSQSDTLSFWYPEGRLQAEGGSAFLAFGVFGNVEEPEAIGSYVARSEQSKGLAVSISITDQAPRILLPLYDGDEVKIQLNDPANADQKTFLLVNGGDAAATSEAIGNLYQMCELIT